MRAAVRSTLTAVLLLGGAALAPSSATAQSEELLIEGAADSAYAATVSGPDVKLPLEIVSQVDKDVEASVSVSSLRAPGNDEVVPIVVNQGDRKLTGSDKVTVPALRRLSLTLETTVRDIGAHRGSIDLIYSGARHTTALTITRERPLPSVSIEPVGATTSNHVRVTVRETDGRTVTLDRPTLLPLLKVDEDTSESADYDSVRIDQVKGADKIPVQDTLAIPPLGNVELVVDVDGLPAQGKYEGTLRLANAADKAAVETKLTFLRRRDWRCPLLLLAIGIGLAEALRWAARRSAHLRDQAAVATRRDRLRLLRRHVAPAEGSIGEVLAALDNAMEDMFLRVGAGAISGSKLESELAGLDGRIDMVPAYATVWREAQKSDTAKNATRVHLEKVAAYLTHGGDAAKAQEALAATRAALAAPAPHGVIEAEAADGREAPTPKSADLKRRLRWLTLGVTTIGGSAAVLVGFLLLYLPQKTWGSPTDMLTMFLWALGVQQVANVAAASSAQAMVDKIQKPAPTA